MSMVESYQPGGYHPHRKALPPGATVQLPPRSQSPLVSIDPNPQHSGRTFTMTSLHQQQQPQQQQQPPYSRPTNTNPISHQAYMNQYSPTTRRTLSNATTSTSSTGNGPARANSTSSSQLQRSTSSRSGSSPNSYVALMRKQKATVWCDRAQVSRSTSPIPFHLSLYKHSRLTLLFSPFSTARGSPPPSRSAGCKTTCCNRSVLLVTPPPRFLLQSHWHTRRRSLENAWSSWWYKVIAIYTWSTSCKWCTHAS